jgi:hypothetical protein
MTADEYKEFDEFVKYLDEKYADDKIIEKAIYKSKGKIK